MTSDKIRIALLPGATFSDLMEILQKHLHFIFLREVNIGPYLYYLLKVNIETRDLIYVYNQWFDEDLVSLRQEPKVTAVEVEFEYLMDDNMYDSEVLQLWNLNGSITPSQNIPITWKRKSFTGKDQTIAFVELEYMQTNHRDLVNQVVQDNTINWDYSNNSPYPISPSPYEHGTYVAGVAIAQGGNDFCLVGVAPDATGIATFIIPAISIGRKATDSDCASAQTHQLGKVDIYNGSWGPKKFTAKFMHVPVCEFAMSEGGIKVSMLVSAVMAKEVSTSCQQAMMVHASIQIRFLLEIAYML
ncbi:unnamed protein product [Mytilus edulis]|uniref:Peptidase S8/S53 domain-containing protein n=1 Tax=Mytilus edulis TaxID=6550 RepID=A0A8S3R307_MYTED|nr:unnamed protein product [Mytilus edulis]